MTTIFSDPIIPERTSHRYTGTFVDATGTAIPAASIVSITATLRDVTSDTIINGRSAQNVLNANGGVLNPTTGVFTLSLTPDDAPILAGGLRRQKRLLTLHVTYTDGELYHEVIYYVDALRDAPEGGA
jgi:hypothetical protein